MLNPPVLSGEPQSGGYGGEHRDEHVDYHLPSFLLHSNPPFLSLIGYTIAFAKPCRRLRVALRGLGVGIRGRGA